MLRRPASSSTRRRRESATSTVRAEQPSNGITLLTLDRPERLNTVTRDVVGELFEMVSDISDDAAYRHR